MMTFFASKVTFYTNILLELYYLVFDKIGQG